MERFLVIVVLISIVILISLSLRAYQDIAEPFILTAKRTPYTKNTTGRFTDEIGKGAGFYHCKRDDDTSDKNASLPTCTEMRKGMIQKARDDGQIPDIPENMKTKYPSTDDNEITGNIGNLQVILNRTAKSSRHQMCVPFVDCDRYVNPNTKRLYCPVGLGHTTDGTGNTTGCTSFPENNMLNCELDATTGSGRVSCSVLRNIQTVGSGFKLYPPASIISSSLDAQSRTEGITTKKPIQLDDIYSNPDTDSSTESKIIHEKAGLVLNMIRSYTNIVTDPAKMSARQISVISQFFDGVMESYILYQPVGNGNARVGFMRISGLTPDIPDLHAFNGEGPNYELLANDFIPDTLSPPSGLLPMMSSHKQANYRLPQPSNPITRT